MGVSTLFVLFICVAAVAAFDLAAQNQLLSIHNNIRRAVKPAPVNALHDYVWNSTLAKSAQNKANLCQNTHSKWRLYTLRGEVVLYGTALNTSSVYDLLSAHFAGQQADFNYYEGASCGGDKCESFTQVVHNKTKSFGCALVTNCGIGSVLVCQYDAYGHYDGTQPYAAVPNPVSSSDDSNEDYSSVDSTALDSGLESSSYSLEFSSESEAGNDKRDVEALSSVNYRGTHMVTSVKSQGYSNTCPTTCENCWAFAAIAVAEGAYGKKHGKTSPNLSQQEIIECSGAGTDTGGGVTWMALQNIRAKQAGGLASAASYPYHLPKEYAGKCAKTKKKVVHLTDSEVISPFTNAAIVNGLKKYGPISGVVYADSTMQHYRRGILKKKYSNMNHSITIVGYNASKGYWIIKNSWGTSWGISGYMYISGSSSNYGLGTSGYNTYAVAA